MNYERNELVYFEHHDTRYKFIVKIVSIINDKYYELTYTKSSDEKLYRYLKNSLWTEDYISRIPLIDMLKNSYEKDK